MRRYTLLWEWLVVTHAIAYSPGLPDWFMAFDLYERAAATAKIEGQRG